MNVQLKKTIQTQDGRTFKRKSVFQAERQDNGKYTLRLAGHVIAEDVRKKVLKILD